MAIAFDAATDGGNNGGSTSSRSFSHTCTGANLILWVEVWGDLSAGADDISSVTYNSVAMTFVGKVQGVSGRWNYLYCLFAPSTGSNTVTITAGSNHYIGGLAASYTGAAQTGVPDASTTNGSTSSPLTTTLTTAADNCWVVIGGYANFHIAAGTGSTLRVTDAAFNIAAIFDSGGPVTPAGPVSMSFSDSATPKAPSAIMASFAPATGGATIHPYWLHAAQRVIGGPD